MKIKLACVCVVAAAVSLQPCIAEETSECSACLYLYENLQNFYNNSPDGLGSNNMREQGDVACNNYGGPDECLNILNQYFDDIYRLLQNDSGLTATDACFGTVASGYLQLCSCWAGEQLSGSSCTPCSRGWYKSDAMSSCTRCPRQDGVYGTTATTGSTAVTDCYLSAGTAFSDTTGSGTYAEDCYYK